MYTNDTTSVSSGYLGIRVIKPRREGTFFPKRPSVLVFIGESVGKYLTETVQVNVIPLAIHNVFCKTSMDPFLTWYWELWNLRETLDEIVSRYPGEIGKYQNIY